MQSRQTAVTSFIMMYIPSNLHSPHYEHATWHLPVNHAHPVVHLTLASLLHRTILANMDVQPLGLVVHRLHAVGLEDAVFFGEVGLGEGLLYRVSRLSHNYDEGGGDVPSRRVARQSSCPRACSSSRRHRRWT
jgi:hypothetical protein